MAQRKPYNPNTAYGRKKRREQAEEYRQNLPTEERGKFDESVVVGTIIIVVIVLVLIYAVSGFEGILKWLRR